LRRCSCRVKLYAFKYRKYAKQTNLLQNTAILVFSRSANAEQKHKILHTNAAKNLQLHQALYNKTIAIVKETNLPFIIIDEVNQHGERFGERFCNAIEYCFGRGYNNLITIGSDCAGLSAQDILKANSQLQNNCNSIGADSHGGFYLLALQKRYYQRSFFLNFKWGSNQLFKNISIHFKNNLQATLFLLATQSDINTGANLKAAINFLLPSVFIKLLSSLFNSISNHILSLTSLLQHIFSTGFALRGPPTVATF
jgi:uncharacterized protein